MTLISRGTKGHTLEHRERIIDMIPTESEKLFEVAFTRLAAAKSLPDLCDALMYVVQGLVYMNRAHKLIYDKLEQIDRKLSSASATYKTPSM